MEQRSKEWFEARIGRVTGSVVGAILGVDPWRGPDDVMRDMVRAAYRAEKEFKGNIATEYGQQHEEIAKKQFQMDYLLEVTDASFEKHEDWLGASPDGYIDEEDAVLEIKCPFSMRSKNPDQFKTLDQQPHYYAQIQSQLFVTGRSKCYFYQWCPNGAKLEIVHKDAAWQQKNLPRLYDFWVSYCDEVNNNAERHLKPKRKEINSREAQELINEHDKLCEVLEDTKARIAEIKERLVNMADGHDADICGRKLTRVEKPGAISYSKAVKDNLQDLDLDRYRGKPTVFWKLT